MSFEASSQSLTPPAKTAELEIPPLDLQLPQPLEIQHDGNVMFAWDLEGLAIITKIFIGYTLWAENYIAESEHDAILEFRLEICTDRLALKDQNIQDLKDDREHAYDLFFSERDEQSKVEVKNALKTILISTGTGIVGVAVGIIIGVVAVRN